MIHRFDTFMSQLKATNATLSFYADFPKIAQNVQEVAISLTMLNYLLGKEELRGAVEALWQRDPSCFQVMDILIATRAKEHKLYIDGEGNIHPIHSLFDSVDGVMTFLEETGLAHLFRSGQLKDLVDYVFGVETGLDSNARKNRSGTLMENVVASVFREAGLEFAEQESSDKHPAVAAVLGKDTKCFDFAVKTQNKTYLIEVNFYSASGSKLNEVARSYTEIAPKVNRIPGYEFVWITDGVGWLSAKSKLQEAFAAIPSIYNITTLGELVNRLRNS